MKLSEYKTCYYEFSGKASDISRHLAFAGIAVIWIFRLNQKGELTIPNELLLPLILMVVTLGFDILQYISATTVWGIYQWYKERELEDPKIDPDIDHPSWLKWPQFIFFVLKLISILVGYYFLLKHFCSLWL